MGARPVCPKLLQGTLAGGLERGTRQQQPITTRTHGAMRHLPAGARTEQQLCCAANTSFAGLQALKHARQQLSVSPLARSVACVCRLLQGHWDVAVSWWLPRDRA